MRKATSTTLTLLLAALVAIPLASSGPSRVPSDTSRLAAVESPGFPSARPADPLARPLPALKTRSLHDGHGVAPTAAQAVSNASPSLGFRLLRLDPAHHPAPVTGSARQLPAFPTGPPSHI
jgi:hypothetical protein